MNKLVSKQTEYDIGNEKTSHESTIIHDSTKTLSPRERNVFGCLNSNPDFITKSIIKKYPANGSSPYLISKIFIIGYDKSSLQKIVRKHCKDKPISGLSGSVKKKDYIHIKEKPIILHMFTSEYNANYTNKHIQTDFIIDFIYPKRLKLFLIEKLRIHNIMFKINIPPAMSKKKMSSDNANNNSDNYNRTQLIYYAYTYHRKTTVNGKNYYAPLAICIQTNYPYLANYSVLCKYYSQQLASKYMNELWLYHLVNLPAPINSPYQLLYFPSPEINYTQPLLFYQLSGYPLLYIKVGELFNILPYDIIIKLFVFTFLEQDIIFFSENLEVLNTVMYIFAQLNFPLSNSNYFSNILSVSLNTFIEGTSQYLTKTYPYIIGVNTGYDPSYDAYSKKKAFFIVDINNKIVQYKIKSPDAIDELGTRFNKSQKLFEYITKLIDYSNPLSNYFEIAFSQLKTELMKISSCITHPNLEKEEYLPDFYSISPELQTNNLLSPKSIQEKFYSFILAIFSYFYSFNNLEMPISKKEGCTINNYDNKLVSINLDASLLHFGKLFRKCEKYNTFNSDFVQNFKCYYLDYIPLSYMQECIHQSMCNTDLNLKTFAVLDVLDEYYQINNNIGHVLTMDNYFNSLIVTSKSSYNALFNENNVYNQEIVKYIKSFIDNLKRKKKKTHKMEQKELFHLIYLSKNNEKTDPFKLKSRFEVKCVNMVVFAQWKNRFMKRNSLSDVKINNSVGSALSIQSYKSFLNVNDITNDYISIMQEIIERRYIKELSINEVILCCYVNLFVISKIVEQNDSRKQLEVIVDLLLRHKHIYSFRLYIAILINHYVSSMKNRKNALGNNESNWNIDDDEDINESHNDFGDQDEDDDDDKRSKHSNNTDNDETRKCLIILTWLIKELNYIPNNDFMSCLNNAFENKYITLRDISVMSNNNSQVNINSQPKPIISSKAFMRFNIGRSGLYKENYFIQLARNMSYIGNLYIEELNQNQNENQTRIERTKTINRTNPVIDVNFKKTGTENNRLSYNVFYKNNRYSTPIYSPMKLFNLLNDIFKRLTVNSDRMEKVTKNALLEICCVLIFYVGNMNDIFKINNTKEVGIDEKYKHNDYIIFLYDIIDRIENI